jgi:hypothetical protein
MHKITNSYFLRQSNAPISIRERELCIAYKHTSHSSNIQKKNNPLTISFVVNSGAFTVGVLLLGV